MRLERGARGARHAILELAAIDAKRSVVIVPARDLSVVQVAANALVEGLAQIEQHIDGVRLRRDSESLHQLRVGIRRFRAAARLARQAGLPAWSEGVRSDLKWLWRVLGDARDWDVFVVVTWPAVKRAADRQESAPGFGQHAIARRAARQRALHRALASRRFDEAIRALRAFASSCGCAVLHGGRPRRGKKVAARLLTRRAEIVLRRGAHIGRLSSDAQHALRIDVKKLRYLGETLSQLYDGDSAARYLKRVAAIQSTLGCLNDLAVSRKVVHSVAADLSRHECDAAIQMWDRYETQGTESLVRELAKRWKKFTGTKPFWD